MWSGNDDDMHFCRHVLGAQGSISVASNVVPGLYRELLFGERNDELNAELAPLVKWLFEQPNPIGVNTLLMQLGACGPNFRLPYVSPDIALFSSNVFLFVTMGQRPSRCFC